MALTNNLKTQVDLPVWEWCRFAPASPTAVSSLTTGNTLGNRYLYYQISAELYRYDTITDSWNRLTNMTGFTTPTIMNNNVLTNAVGHPCRAIGAGTGNNTVQMAGLSGTALVGYKIRIVSGTGAGQERTITAVSAPIVADRGVITTGGTQSIIDASTGIGLKQWKINQWRGYQLRVEFGTGRTQMREVLFNGTNSLTWSDATYTTVDPWAQPLSNISFTAASIYQIESHIVTVDTNWTTNPDSTSKMMVMSGGIWNITQGVTSSPFFSLSYYDILADQWYGKSTQAGLKTAVFLAGSDLSMERMTETGGVIFTETASAGSSKSITAKVGTTFTPMQYANFEVRIVGGTGIGQVRTIVSNTSTVINVSRAFDTAPDATSVYEIWRDVGRIWLVGGGDAGMLQYSVDSDQWTTASMLDFGQCNQLAATRSGQYPFAITSITRTATSMVNTGTISTAGTGYNIDDILTVDAKGGTLRVTSINPANGAVTGVSLETCGTGYTTGAKATTVSPAGGTGCQITLGASDIDFTELVVTPINHNFSLGESVTIVGATGTGAAKFNGTYTIIGTPSLTQFSYCSVGDPGAATATIPFSPSTTVLVDCTKNWVVNEHAGKLIQISNNALLAGSAQCRKIVSNTATTITWTLATSASTPANGTYRYVITKPVAFGAETTLGAKRGGGNEGFATGGSTTTLVDSTKNWQTNYWSRTAQRKLLITEGTGAGSEIAITSNTNNTLTYATQTFTPDATTRYVILDAAGQATGGTTTTLTDSAKNWDTNCWVGKRVRFLSGTSQGNEYTITANTATQLTFATGTAPDTSTAYTILQSSPRSFGLHLDNITGCTNTALNHKYMYCFTGSGTVEFSRYDITSEKWELMSYFPQFELPTTGTMYVYDGKDRIYINLSPAIGGITGRIMYYDLVTNKMENASTIPYGHSTAVSGNRMEIIQTADGLKYLYVMRHSGQEMWRTLLFY